YEYILFVVNRLTKIRHFILIEGLLIEKLVEKFINYIYILYSLSNTIISDRGI
ncbi:hypothetical protein NEUTE1DRAFT_51434, partial [Neurospora tetrasperma FGSC 2508]